MFFYVNVIGTKIRALQECVYSLIRSWVFHISICTGIREGKKSICILLSNLASSLNKH